MKKDIHKIKLYRSKKKTVFQRNVNTSGINNCYMLFGV